MNIHKGVDIETVLDSLCAFVNMSDILDELGFTNSHMQLLRSLHHLLNHSVID